MNPRFFADLRRHEVKTAAELMAAAQRARVILRDRIKAAGTHAINAKFRDAFFGKVANIYRLLSGEMDAILKSATGKTANMARKAFFEARVAAGDTVRAKVVQFSPERLERYWGMIHPDNAPTLAATSKMATDEVQGLRNAVVQVFRQGDLEAWTANTRAKKLQDAWDAVAGDANPRRFVDGAGREWSNARYLQMLVRTTQARVSREALIDTTVENGDDLMRVVTAGDNCPICETWGGLIVSVTGTNEKFPSYEAAIDAGLFHPNCLPGDAIVSAGDVLAAFRFRFQGDLIRVVLGGGRSLRVSPNHPILSARGWVVAKELHQGDKVFSACGGEGVASGAPDIDHAPARADQVFMALSKSEGVRSGQMPLAAEHFHGDAGGGEGQVEVIWADRPLRLHREASGPEGVGQLAFRRADVGRDGMPTQCDLAAMLRRVGLATHRRVRGLCPLHAGFRGGVGMPSGEPFPWGAEDDPGSLQDAGEACAADAGGVLHGKDIFAGLVSADDVLRVERERFDGHLFDLLTVEGCYLAGEQNAITIVSNCDCSLERIDETIDETDAQNQEDAKTPPDLSDLEALREYRIEAGLDSPDAPGEEPGTFAREAAAAYRAEVDD